MLRILVERAGTILQDEVFSNEVVSIGRDPDRDVVLDSPIVSGLHLVIKADADQRTFRYIDQSANGTWVSGERVATGTFDTPVMLRVADFDVTLIPVGRTGTTEEPLPGAPRDSRESTLPGMMISGVRTAREGTAEIRLVSGFARPNALTFNDRIVVGRSSHCDISCPSPEVSRQHFDIQRVGSEFRLRRISKRNAVEVNGQKLGRDEQRALNTGDLIAFCGQELVFFTPARAIGSLTRKTGEDPKPNVDLGIFERVCIQRDIMALDIVGFLGSATIEKFDSGVRERLKQRSRILVDLGYLSGVDPVGTKALVRFISDAEEQGTRVQLIRVPPRIADSFSSSPFVNVLSAHVSGNEMSGVRKLNNPEERA